MKEGRKEMRKEKEKRDKIVWRRCREKRMNRGIKERRKEGRKLYENE